MGRARGGAGRWLQPLALARLVGWASLGFGVLLFVAPALSAQLFGMGDHAALMRYIGARDLFIGAAIFLDRRLSLWMMARAIADSTDVAICVFMLVTGTPYAWRAVLGLALAAGFCVLDFWIAQRLRQEARPATVPALALSRSRRRA